MPPPRSDICNNLPLISNVYNLFIALASSVKKNAIEELNDMTLTSDSKQKITRLCLVRGPLIYMQRPPGVF
jgi:hypothetical protein